jgi:tripartite-type tricarboxylate transporter receptor subunit TctC
MKSFVAPSRLLSRALLAAMLVATAGASLAQQAFPNRPIRLITPYAAGSSPDTIARMIGPKLTEAWGQQVLVDPRPGGNTVIGSDAMAKSKPDGYTLLLISTTHVLNGLLVPNLPYDTVKDFAPVATIASSELVQVVHPSVPGTTLKEFIAYAKSKPGQVSYATASAGGPTHMAPELLSMMTGIKLLHVPYKGSGPAVTDLVGGQVNMYFSAPISVLSFINTGKLKALAISGDARSPVLPQVPTFTELGMPGMDLRFWYGVLAPAGTPKDVLDKLSAEIGKIVVAPDMKDKLSGQGADPFVNTPERFAALIKADLAKYDKVIKAANIKLNL